MLSLAALLGAAPGVLAAHVHSRWLVSRLRVQHGLSRRGGNVRWRHPRCRHADHLPHSANGQLPTGFRVSAGAFCGPAGQMASASWPCPTRGDNRLQDESNDLAGLERAGRRHPRLGHLVPIALLGTPSRHRPGGSVAVRATSLEWVELGHPSDRRRPAATERSTGCGSLHEHQRKGDRPRNLRAWREGHYFSMIKEMDIATFEVSPSAVTVWNGSFLFFEWGTTPEQANCPSLSTTVSQIVTVVGFGALYPVT